MIDISPPSSGQKEPSFPLRRKIPPRELIRQKIAESEMGAAPILEEKEVSGARVPSAVPGAVPTPPKPAKARAGVGVILALIFIFLMTLAAIAGAGFNFLQIQSLSQRAQKLEAAGALPLDLEAKIKKIEELEKNLSEFRKLATEKINGLEDKINKVSTANFADKTTVEKLEEILKTTDSDKDGLSDYEEVVIYTSDPNLKDTDGDTFLDKTEVEAGYNPTGPGKLEKKIVPEAEAKATSVKASKYFFDPEILEAELGKAIQLELSSLDSEHTFTIDEFEVNQKIPAGSTSTIEFIPDKVGEFTFYSNTEEDKANKMEGKLIVK